MKSILSGLIYLFNFAENVNLTNSFDTTHRGTLFCPISIEMWHLSPVFVLCSSTDNFQTMAGEFSEMLFYKIDGSANNRVLHIAAGVDINPWIQIYYDRKKVTVYIFLLSTFGIPVLFPNNLSQTLMCSMIYENNVALVKWFTKIMLQLNNKPQ